jgi:hexosaminidase
MAPRFRWRGAMLDIARHFQPKREILRFIDLLALHKLNVLHLHLTDDQGWRVEIRRYPKLTGAASWRTESQVGTGRPPVFDGRPHGGFLTQDDIREIVAYADARHVAVVPEIDVPGHSQAAIHAYPELGEVGEIPVGTQWGVFDEVLAVTDHVLEFYKNVFDELIELFPSTYVHVGGDECPKTQWKNSVSAQQRIKDEGLADEDELQSWFIRQLDDHLTERGRRLLGWDEILEGGLAPGATVMSWRGEEGGIEAVTMESVAARARVSKGLGYAYFDNRNDLLLTLLEREITGRGLSALLLSNPANPTGRMPFSASSSPRWVNLLRRVSPSRTTMSTSSTCRARGIASTTSLRGGESSTT